MPGRCIRAICPFLASPGPRLLGQRLTWRTRSADQPVHPALGNTGVAALLGQTRVWARVFDGRSATAPGATVDATKWLLLTSVLARPGLRVADSA